MIRSARDLERYVLEAADGNIGRISDIYFDDLSWTVRYLVVDTGNWLTGRRVLISPIALGQAQPRERRLRVNLSKDQVRNSPDIDTARPISRQKEIEYFRYYGWPAYWAGGGLWGVAATPYAAAAYAYGPPPPMLPIEEQSVAPPSTEEAHLRAVDAIIGYAIQARDGQIGRVEDFLVDEESWAVERLIVDATSWWPGGKVAISPEYIESIAWELQAVVVSAEQEEIRNRPQFRLSSLGDTS